MSKVETLAQSIGLDMKPCGFYVAIMLIEENYTEGSFERTDKGGPAQYGFIVDAGADAEKLVQWNGVGEPLTGCKVMVPKTGGQVYKNCSIVDVRDVKMYTPGDQVVEEFLEHVKTKL